MVQSGGRIRVTAPECELRKAEGTLTSPEDGLLSAASENRDIECPTEAVTRLDVFSGKRGWGWTTLKGIGIGFGVGLIMGVIESRQEYSEGLGLPGCIW
jgi:hypothetical protein